MMRVAGIAIAIALFVLAIPAGIRAERASRTASVQRLLIESARCLFAIAAAAALLITSLWG